ncbi:MFS general substrate transporter [Crepidotus variabilis]|uniref:MFS general substrate transporter n=1 Tax=Crepidotus variabilis TaxID=179855 RepID=A0A9P6E5W9_9AGAR|nr:MFS general substrate transporter [Crepidotus variabilis]
MSTLEKRFNTSLEANDTEKTQIAASSLNSQLDPPSIDSPPQLTAEQEQKLYRKIDLRLMPILSLMYLFSFLDRGNIGNARLQGLETQLHLGTNEYNIALTMYFIPYCLCECPTNLVLKYFRPSRWLPGITVAWGIIMTLMGFVKTYPQLVGVRMCLGVAEAGLFPGVVYYLTLWYPRHQLQLRIGLFFGAASLAGAFSGLLAYGISFMSGKAGLLGWSWIFILEGVATVTVGLVSFFVLVDYPSSATFLTEEEKAFVIHKKKYDNSSVGEEEHFEFRHISAAAMDWQLWTHILLYFSIMGPLYGITLFLPTIIKTFGYSSAISQLLTVPPYVLATVLVFVFAYYSDKFRVRSPFILIGQILCLIGFFINISKAPSGVKYFGTFFVVSGSYAAFPGIVAWLGNNLAGQYKRGIGMATHIGIGNFIGAIAANIYRSQDSPRFILGHALEIVFVGIGLFTLPILILIYTRINAKREQKRLAQGSKQYSVQELRELGDRAPDFRYTL